MTGSSADDDLVARAKSGDEAAWRELYEANAGRLIVWLRSRPSGDAAAEPRDIAAEAWFAAASKIADFSGTSSDFAGWLFAIARNISRNTHRTAQRRHTYPVALDTEDGLTWGTTPDSLKAVECADWTRRLLAQLPSREAEVVACIDVVGLDVSSTSRALGISAAAVRVSHHRGLRRLRELVGKIGQPGPREQSSIAPHRDPSIPGPTNDPSILTESLPTTDEKPAKATVRPRRTWPRRSQG